MEATRYNHAELAQRAPIAFERAVVFALVTAAIAIIGHDLVANTKTPFSVIVLTSLLAFFTSRVMATIQMSVTTIAVALSGMQVALHLLATISSPLGTQHHFTPSGLSISGAAIMMISVHVGATILGTIIIASLESFAWQVLSAPIQRTVKALSAMIAVIRRKTARAPKTTSRLFVQKDRTKSSLTASQRIRKRGPPVRIESTFA